MIRPDERRIFCEPESEIPKSYRWDCRTLICVHSTDSTLYRWRDQAGEHELSLVCGAVR